MESLGLRSYSTRLVHHQQQHVRIQKQNPPLGLNLSRNTQSCATATNFIISIPAQTQKQHENKIKMSPDKLDEWMNHCVSEIVRHIGEAPFLVHLTLTTTRDKMRLEVKREGSWSSVKRRWEQGCPIPDGVILVEQLDHDHDDLNAETKVWGVLIQGKGVDTPACYILKTCRVSSSLGFFCTHFCLVKAKCFGDAADLQLLNSWNGINL